MRARDTRTLLLGLLPCCLAWAASAADHLVVVRDGSTHAVEIDQRHSYAATSLTELAEALGYERVGAGLRMDGELVRFATGTAFFTAAGEVYQLTNPVYSSGSELMVPLSWSLDWLPTRRSRSWRYMDGRLVKRQPTVQRPAPRTDWMVVIDAGHGGVDPGTIGVGGTKEKDITLAIARRLTKRLEREAGISVVMTRDQDTLIALTDRPRVIQRRGAEGQAGLFVSIHANSMPKKPHATRGHEVYFLSHAKTEQARRVAMRENSALRFEQQGDSSNSEPLQFILSDLQSTGNLQESSLFASSVSRNLATQLSTPDLGVKQGPFAVLVGSTVPAVLVEVGYLSNRAEEKQLRSASHQANIADALADAIVEYLAEYGRRVWSYPRSAGG
ncbi:MAG: N-acetylmuramoyl-L-alanine amidase [Gemmatimonadota bacterium]|nr:MAG: N-acetylmuramoyl-L-alanine amidase [Gemmatimonadota bacterium]